MARGWESKAVEDQIAERAAAKEKHRAPDVCVDPEREARRQQLQLARARTLQDLPLACGKRHRALLQRTLDHLDAELRRL